LQNAEGFSQIFLNPLAGVLTAIIKLHRSYKLFFETLLEICAHPSGGFRKAVCS
jgi:hypothetical protein